MYKFDEDKSLDEIKKYIDKTYDAHYSKGKYQCTEMIMTLDMEKVSVSEIF